MYLFVKPLQCRPQDNLQTDALTARFLNQLQPSNLISEYFAWHPESTIHIKIPARTEILQGLFATRLPFLFPRTLYSIPCSSPIRRQKAVKTLKMSTGKEWDERPANSHCLAVCTFRDMV